MKEYAPPDPPYGPDFGSLKGNNDTQEYIGMDGSIVSITETFRYKGTVRMWRPYDTTYGRVELDFPVMGTSVGLFDDSSVAVLRAIYPFLVRRIKGGVKVQGRAQRVGSIHYLVCVNPCSSVNPRFFERLRMLYQGL